MPKRYLTTQEKRAFAQRTLDNIREHLGEDATVVILPSNMLAGPCEIPSRLADEEFLVGEAPLAPFDGCTHPDQCACIISVRSFKEL